MIKLLDQKITTWNKFLKLKMEILLQELLLLLLKALIKEFISQEFKLYPWNVLTLITNKSPYLSHMKHLDIERLP